MRTLLIVPTRGRPDSAREFADEFLKNTTEDTDLLFGVDDDDVWYPDLGSRVKYDRNPRMGMNGTLNFLARKYAYDYDYIAFAGDDHRVRTRGWDALLVESISDIKYGIAYGNDLIQGANLPTAVLLDARIIRILGYMAPPEQKHLYLDDFWRDLGNELGTLRYSEDVIIEHMHFSVGKSAKDAQYEQVNSGEMYDHDRMAYEKYKAEQRPIDIEKLSSGV